MTEVKASLRAVLKRLKLSGMVPTLPDRAAYAAKASLGALDFLELALQDEIDRRETKNLSTRLDRAGFEEAHTFEDFDWDAPVTFDRDRVRDLFNLGFLERTEDILFLGPVGVGKTFLACALGHGACRAGKRVLFLRSDELLKRIHQSRADNSTEKVLRSLLAPDLLIIDDFGLRRLSAQQSSDFYEVIIERHRRASTIVTSNRAYRKRPTISASLQRRQQGQDPSVLAHAWKCQHRLFKVFHRLAVGKPRQVAATAVARELVGFLWAVLSELDVSQLQHQEADQAA